VEYRTPSPQVNEECRAIAARDACPTLRFSDPSLLRPFASPTLRFSDPSLPQFSQTQVLFADAIGGLLVSVDGAGSAARH
jgi:hypothetical protein